MFPLSVIHILNTCVWTNFWDKKKPSTHTLVYAECSLFFIDPLRKVNKKYIEDKHKRLYFLLKMENYIIGYMHLVRFLWLDFLVWETPALELSTILISPNQYIHSESRKVWRVKEFHICLHEPLPKPISILGSRELYGNQRKRSLTSAGYS